MFLEAPKPKVNLLKGKYGGAYKERSFARVLKQAAERSKIQNTSTVGTILPTICKRVASICATFRNYPGLPRPKTTMIYTHFSSKHLSRITSPFDELDL